MKDPDIKDINARDTPQLIHDLAADLSEPSESLNWKANFWFSWAGCISVMAIMTYLAAAFLPKDIHLPQDLKNAAYWIELTLWLILGLSAAFMTSSFARPRTLNGWSPRFAWVVLAMLLSTILLNITPSAFASQMSEELHWKQGPCGFFILFTGLVSSLWMFYIIKKAAPVDLIKTSTWAAISVGALGSFFMHLVCTHENSVHTFLWHVSPLFLLAFIAAWIGPKALRW